MHHITKVQNTLLNEGALLPIILSCYRNEGAMLPLEHNVNSALYKYVLLLLYVIISIMTNIKDTY